MCKNSPRYKRTRNFEPCGHAESKKTQKFVFRSALRPNQISFSHSQDPNLTSARFLDDEEIVTYLARLLAQLITPPPRRPGLVHVISSAEIAVTIRLPSVPFRFGN